MYIYIPIPTSFYDSWKGGTKLPASVRHSHDATCPKTQPVYPEAVHLPDSGWFWGNWALNISLSLSMWEGYGTTSAISLGGCLIIFAMGENIYIVFMIHQIKGTVKKKWMANTVTWKWLASVMSWGFEECLLMVKIFCIQRLNSKGV